MQEGQPGLWHIQYLNMYESNMHTWIKNLQLGFERRFTYRLFGRTITMICIHIYIYLWFSAFSLVLSHQVKLERSVPVQWAWREGAGQRRNAPLRARTPEKQNKWCCLFFLVCTRVVKMIQGSCATQVLSLRCDQDYNDYS